MKLKPVILLILSLLAATLAMPNGAPNTACDSMTPSPGDKAHGPDVQTTNFNQNYGVTCKETQPGKVEVTIDTKSSLRGILLQIRRPDGKRVGTFNNPTDSNDFKTSCNAQAITHKNKNDKTQKLTFVADIGSENAANLRCVMTVVQEAKTYWVKETFPVQTLPQTPPAPRVGTGKPAAPVRPAGKDKAAERRARKAARKAARAAKKQARKGSRKNGNNGRRVRGNNGNNGRRRRQGKE